jgi:hypothetical protein
MTQPKFAICTDDSGFKVSLEIRKLYQILPDKKANLMGQFRVIDESGEDYLYPSSYFVPVDLPASVANQVVHAA